MFYFICLFVLILHTHAEVSEENSVSFIPPQDFISYGNVQPLNAYLKSGYPGNCAEATADSKQSGPYFVQVERFIPHPFVVYCENDVHGGGWTVVQRRQDGSVDFDRNWREYKFGFGNLAGEFWLGLEKMHALTAGGTQELIVLLEDWNSTRVYAKYDQFQLGSEVESYTLNVVGTHSGSVGDELSAEAGMPFSTKDLCGPQCSDKISGGWWFRNGLSYCNLNGKFFKGYYDGAACHFCGISWDTFHRLGYSLKSTHMMIRPSQK